MSVIPLAPQGDEGRTASPAAAAAIARSPAAARRPDIDGLRNLAIGYLFVFHTARVFDASEPFYVEGAPSTWTTFLVHASPWFMPLLFVLAGMSSRFALARRPLGTFARERLTRLGVPLLFGLAVVVPPQAYLGLLSHADPAEPGPPYPAFLGGYWRDWSDLSGYHGTVTPGQLWFLLFLLVISLGLAPIMVRFARRDVTRLLGGPLLVLVPVAGLALLSLTPAIGGKNLLVDAGWVSLGWVLARDDSVVDALAARRHAWGATAAVGLVAAATVTVGGPVGRLGTPGALAFGLGEIAVTWVAVLAGLGYGRRHLTGGVLTSPWLSRAGMPVYVLHQTVLVAVAFATVDRGWAMPVEFAVIALGSAAFTYALYAAVATVPPLAFLLGAKAPRRTPAGRRA